MPVADQTPYKEYVANGTTTTFPLEFDCDSADHLIVKINDIDIPALNNWSLNIITGSVVFSTAPLNTSKVILQRDTPLSRDTDYESYSNSFRPKPVNKDFDRIWLKLQELGVIDWLLGNKINALRDYVDAELSELHDYVDSQNDDLKNYLLAQIYEQGVALSQLESYYEYLFQRLAEISNGNGWDASFVADGNETQKQINDKTIQSVETINDLKNFIPRMNGQMVYVKGFRAGSSDGYGFFQWYETSTETEVSGMIVKVASLTNGRFIRSLDQNRINVLDCGAYRDGATETHTFLKTALNYAISKNIPCYAPRGTYLLGGRVDPSLFNNCNALWEGDAAGQTILKEKDGLTLILGRYNMSVYFIAPDGVTANSVIVRNITIDKNGHTSPVSVPGSYDYEQAHCLAIASGWNNSKIRYVEVTNVQTKDKIGGGVVLTQGTIDKATITNISGTDFQHNGGQRGDFEFQAVVLDLQVSGSSGPYTQCEPNVPQPPNGAKCKAKFVDCNYAITELTAYSGSPTSQVVEFSNHDANNNMTIRWAKIIANNTRFKVGNGQNDFWEGIAPGSTIEESEITVKVNADNTFSSFYLKTMSNQPTGLKITNTKFKADVTATGTTTGFAINNVASSNAYPYLLELEGVEFDTAFERTANCYSNGSYIFRRCKLVSRAGSLGALQVGANSTFVSNVELENNDLTNVNSNLMQFVASNTLWSCNFKGTHDFAKSTFTLGGATSAATVEACVKAEGVFTSDTVPTGKGVLGWRVKINKPQYGYGSEYTATVTSSINAVYQLSSQNGVKSDITANRPSSLTTASRGLRYFDTQLVAAGKPIHYNGSNWVDSTGTVV